MIMMGILAPGDQLPTVKALSEYLGVNPNTVAKAYFRLRERGYVESMPGMGVFVSEKAKELRGKGLDSGIRMYLRNCVIEALNMRISREEVIRMLEEEWKKWEKEMKDSGWQVRNVAENERLRETFERKKKFS